MVIKGQTVKKGVGIGKVLLLTSFQHLSLQQNKKFNFKNELKLFEKVRKKVITQLNLILSICTTSIEKDMINTHLAMAYDEVFFDEITTLINGGSLASKAISSVIDKYIAELNDLNKPYLKARINDLNDLKKLFLDNFEDSKKLLTINKPTVLVIDETSIYHLIYYKNEYLKGVVAKEIIKDSHFAILVNALNVPIVICPDTNGFINNTDIIIDGYKGLVYHDEIDEKILKKYQSYVQDKEAKKQNALHTLANYQQPFFNTTPINVLAGISSVLELGKDYYYPSGLIAMRTELIFKQKVTKNYQIKIISEIIKHNPSSDLYIRLFDISYDKKIGIVDSDIKISPFGLRGIRYLLDNKTLLRSQLNSCFTAVSNADRPLTLNFILPFVTTLIEVIETKLFIANELNVFRSKNQQNNKNLDTFKLGIMVETPAAFFNISEFINNVDFLFLGTSDLHQYMFCDERENNIYHDDELLSPFMLQQFYKITKLCRKKNIPVFVCGKLPCNKLGIILLLNLGYTNFVVNPDKILATTKFISDVNDEKIYFTIQDDNFSDILDQAKLRFKSMTNGG